jgi:hypothetical protein
MREEIKSVVGVANFQPILKKSSGFVKRKVRFQRSSVDWTEL